MWQIHIMECYSTIKKNKLLILSTTQMNLENTILSEKKPFTEDHILYDSTWIKCPE